MKKLWIIILASFSIIGCILKFDVNSVKTKMEKQILGYEPRIPRKKLLKIVTRSQTNQNHNRSQMASLKIRLKDEVINQLKRGSIGEGYDGLLVFGEDFGLSIALPTSKKILITRLIDDENYVRLKLSKIESRSLTDYQYTNIANIWVQNAEGKWHQR